MLTLACRGARVEKDGSRLVDDFDCQATAEQVGLVGPWGFLFFALTGEASSSGGIIELGGVDVRVALRSGKVGVVPCDPVLPDKWTVATYLECGATLLGMRSRPARLVASRTAEALGISTLAARKIGTLHSVERRVAVLAQACLSSPEVLAVDRLFDGLDDSAAEYARAVLSRATDGRRLLLSTGPFVPLSPADRVLRTLKEVLVLSQGVLYQGDPETLFAAGNRYLVTALSTPEALVAALESRGVAVDIPPTVLVVQSPLHDKFALSDHTRLVVRLPEGAGTELIVETAVSVQAPLVELLPLEP